MPYNWPEIVKKKSIKELYDIVIGQTSLCEEAELAAKNELVARGYTLEEPQKIVNKIELESLLEDRDFDNSYFGKRFQGDSKSTLQVFKGGIVLSVFALLNLIFNFTKTVWGFSLFFLLIVIGSVITSYFSYKKKKFQENWRQKRIKELKEEK